MGAVDQEGFLTGGPKTLTLKGRPLWSPFFRWCDIIKTTDCIKEKHAKCAYKPEHLANLFAGFTSVLFAFEVDSVAKAGLRN
jgi:hypothetical protein